MEFNNVCHQFWFHMGGKNANLCYTHQSCILERTIYHATLITLQKDGVNDVNGDNDIDDDDDSEIKPTFKVLAE